MAGSIKLAPLLTEIKVDIENFKNDMEKASAVGTSEAKRISQEMETTAKVGEKFSKAGDLLTKGLTLPIVGAGTAVTKMAVDFESSFAKVSTLLDSNVVDHAHTEARLLGDRMEARLIDAGDRARLLLLPWVAQLVTVRDVNVLQENYIAKLKGCRKAVV